MINYFAAADVCKDSVGIGEAIISVAGIFAFCFIMWLFFRD